MNNSGSQFIYESTVPLFVWYFSSGLAILSLMILCAVLFFRSIRNKRGATYAKRYAELQNILLIHLETPLQEVQKTFIKSEFDLEILAVLSQKLLRITGHQSRIRIHEFIKVLELEDWLFDSARNGKKERLAAIKLIGYLPPSQKNTQILIDILNQENDAQIKYEAIESLSKLGSAENFPVVRKTIQDLPELSPLLIYEIFARFSSSIERELIEIATSKSSAENIQTAAIHTLSDIPTIESARALEILSKHAHQEISAPTYLALSKLALPIDQDTINYGSKHMSWKVRMYSADCAPYAKKMPIEALQKLLNDENWMVSIRAARALFSFGEKGKLILQITAKQNSLAGQRALSYLSEKETETHG